MKPLKLPLLLVLNELVKVVFGSDHQDHLYNTLQGTVGPGNFTYYKLVHLGYIRLLLDSTKGDADLYISSSTSSPSYDEYDISSITCGRDFADIPPDIPRPVTIGVYGHPFHDFTTYLLHVMVITDYDTGYPEIHIDDDDFASSSNTKSNTKHHKKSFGSAAKDEEESILWTIVVGILKIIFDILL